MNDQRSATSGPSTTEEETTAAIVVDNVERRFGRTVALAETSLRVEAGEFVVLNGPSGCGKSTLLHCIAALDSPSAGTITVQGRDIAHHRHQLSRFRRDEIGIVFQLHNLVPRLSAVQNAQLPMFGTHLRRGERRDRAIGLLDEVGLASTMNHAPPEMSGGERQRVAIARALANHPTILLADEPTGSLDDDSAALVIALLQRFRDDTGMTILAVSHDARLDRAADRIFTMGSAHV